MNLVIRRLKEADAQAVSRIVCRNFLEVNIKDYPKEDMERLARVYNRDKILDMNRQAHSYVACASDTVVGCGSIASYWGKEDESILLTVFVAPQWHGRGIGTRLIQALEQDSYFLRANRIEIPASITAYEFYRTLGYQDKNGVKELDAQGHDRLEKFRPTK